MMALIYRIDGSMGCGKSTMRKIQLLNYLTKKRLDYIFAVILTRRGIRVLEKTEKK